MSERAKSGRCAFSCHERLALQLAQLLVPLALQLAQPLVPLALQLAQLLVPLEPLEQTHAPLEGLKPLVVQLVHPLVCVNDASTAKVAYEVAICLVFSACGQPKGVCRGCWWASGSTRSRQRSEDARLATRCDGSRRLPLQDSNFDIKNG